MARCAKREWSAVYKEAASNTLRAYDKLISDPRGRVEHWARRYGKKCRLCALGTCDDCPLGGREWYHCQTLKTFRVLVGSLREWAWRRHSGRRHEYLTADVIKAARARRAYLARRFVTVGLLTKRQTQPLRRGGLTDGCEHENRMAGGGAAMKTRPIIFGAESIHGILDGSKTQTRRVIKPQPPDGTDYVLAGEDGPHALCISTREGGEFGAGIDPWRRCPYGRSGDRLWVRETHYRWTGCNDAPSGWVQSPAGERYNARGYSPDQDDLHDIACACVKVTSRYMPRWASRITLGVVCVGVERVQDISRDDAIAEGCPMPTQRKGMHHWPEVQFGSLWDRLNAKRGYPWVANPWVWVIEFKKLDEQEVADE